MKCNLVLMNILAICLLLFGCSKQAENPEQNGSVYEIIDTNIQIEWQTNKTKQNDWLQKVSSDDKRGIDRLDYEEKTYLLIQGGMHGTQGFKIHIVDIQETEDYIKVIAQIIPPDKDQAVPDAVMNPQLLIRMERTDKEIVLEWRD